jgi:hypothetical protein
VLPSTSGSPDGNDCTWKAKFAAKMVFAMLIALTVHVPS